MITNKKKEQVWSLGLVPCHVTARTIKLKINQWARINLKSVAFSKLNLPWICPQGACCFCGPNNGHRPRRIVQPGGRYTLTLINPIVSLLLVESDTALELTNLLYERLVLFVMECTNVFKLLDTKGAKKDCHLFILWKPQDNVTPANLWALPPVSFRLDFAHPSSSNWHLFQSSVLENDVILLLFNCLKRLTSSIISIRLGLSRASSSSSGLKRCTFLWNMRQLH